MKPNDLTDLLINKGFHFFTGVPDSIFKDFLIDLDSRNNIRHFLSSNEGEACALSAGYHLATNKIPVVYFQNSGLGNCLNPLTSLLDQCIYSIPALLLISWRGSPGVSDEPQHKRMGKILTNLLDLLEIPYRLAVKNSEGMQSLLTEANDYFDKNKSPFAILFTNDIFEPTLTSEPKFPPIFNREVVLNILVDNLGDNDIIVTTTGKTSRELFEIRKQKNHGHHQDFLTVGSMGCSATIALGIALEQPNRKIVAVDGDGAALMRLETLALIGHYRPTNLLHIIVDNNAYESTGSQKTLSATVNFADVARACQYPETIIVQNVEDFTRAVSLPRDVTTLIVVKLASYSRNNLGRPSKTPIENKIALMQFLSSDLS